MSRRRGPPQTYAPPHLRASGPTMWGVPGGQIGRPVVAGSGDEAPPSYPINPLAAHHAEQARAAQAAGQLAALRAREEASMPVDVFATRAKFRDEYPVGAVAHSYPDRITIEATEYLKVWVADGQRLREGAINDGAWGGLTDGHALGLNTVSLARDWRPKGHVGNVLSPVFLIGDEYGDPLMEGEEAAVALLVPAAQLEEFGVRADNAADWPAGLWIPAWAGGGQEAEAEATVARDGKATDPRMMFEATSELRRIYGRGTAEPREAPDRIRLGRVPYRKVYAADPLQFDAVLRRMHAPVWGGDLYGVMLSAFWPRGDAGGTPSGSTSVLLIGTDTTTGRIACWVEEDKLPEALPLWLVNPDVMPGHRAMEAARPAEGAAVLPQEWEAQGDPLPEGVPAGSLYPRTGVSVAFAMPEPTVFARYEAGWLTVDPVGGMVGGSAAPHGDGAIRVCMQDSDPGQLHPRHARGDMQVFDSEYGWLDVTAAAVIVEARRENGLLAEEGRTMGKLNEGNEVDEVQEPGALDAVLDGLKMRGSRKVTDAGAVLARGLIERFAGDDRESVETFLATPAGKRLLEIASAGLLYGVATQGGALFPLPDNLRGIARQVALNSIRGLSYDTSGDVIDFLIEQAAALKGALEAFAALGSMAQASGPAGQLADLQTIGGLAAEASKAAAKTRGG